MKPLEKNQQKRNSAALTLIEVFVVIAMLIILAGLFLPMFDLPNQHRAPRILCVSNLKQIGLAYRMWAGDNGDKFPMQVSITNGGAMELISAGNVFPFFQVMSNELYNPKILVCPSDADRVAAPNFTNGFSAKHISYFVGLDADTNHTQAFLSGDDNFEIKGVPAKSDLLKITTNTEIGWTEKRHNLCGNIGLADGSVQQATSPYLRRMIQQTGLATNGLLLP